MGSIKLSPPSSQTTITLLLILVSWLWQAELLYAQRPPRFRGLGSRSQGELQREYERVHRIYFAKIDRAASQYQQSLAADAKREGNQSWRDFLALPKTIRKLQIELERNTNWTGNITLFTDGDQFDHIIEVRNDYVCQRLMSDLSQLPRTTHDAPHSCKFGKIKICYDDPLDSTQMRQFEIGISDTSFIMGSGSLALAGTGFYSWPLSRVLCDAVKDQNNSLTQLSFNILSGFNSIASPVKLNARAASAKMRDFWSQPADVRFALPNQLKIHHRVWHPTAQKDLDSGLVVCVDVKTHSDSSEDFQWFDTQSQQDYLFRPVWIPQKHNDMLLRSAPTFCAPADVQQCNVMGVICLHRRVLPDVDIFVTDKGFLSYSNSQYHLFHSYDLAAWLEIVSRERVSSLSQKAFNVLSGIDSIVSKQQRYFGMDAKRYNQKSAQIRFVPPEETNNNRP